MRLQERTPEELAPLQQHVQLVDCRERVELQWARLASAVHIPLGELDRRSDELDPDRPVVVFCHHGVRSRTGALLLMAQGFTDVVSMRGGIERWALRVDPSVGRY